MSDLSSLPAGTLVISDLHLDPARAEPDRAFLDFLLAARASPVLLILGDLFDAWVGPAHARLPGAGPILRGLREASDAGLRVHLVPGNRDFLLDASFTAATGVQLSEDGILAGVPSGERVLFVHGDELCTRDKAYQRMKRIVRSGPARWLAPRLPDAVALGVARRLRRASRDAVAAKPPETKRQVPEEVRVLAGRAGATVLVCGHAHEFRDELLEGGTRWLVLDAFGGPRDLLRVGEQGTLEAGSSAAFAARGPGAGEPPAGPAGLI